jgi:hypothetical protein
VHDGVDAREEFREGVRILKADFVEQAGGDGVAMASGQIVDDQDFEAAFDKVMGGDGADITGSSGHLDFRHGAT